MEDNSYLNSALKYGIIGALAFPLIYEGYANIMKSLAVIAAFVICVLAAIRLSKHSAPQAFVGYLGFVLLSCGFGAFAELMLHKHIVAALEKSSEYFYLTIRDTVDFVLYVAACYASGAVIMLMIFAFKAAKKKIHTNGEIAKNVIDNAFGDEVNAFGDDEE